jgi:outer membrane immunogenic protein
MKKLNAKLLPLLIGSLAITGAGSTFANSDWSGNFWGVTAGAGLNLGSNGQLNFSRADGSDNSAAINKAFGENFEGKFESGLVAGIRAGKNWQSDNLVYGVMADISLADLTQEQSGFSATPATYIERRDIKMLSTVRGRLGFANDTPVLPFVTAGLAYGDVDYSWEGNSGAFRGDNGKGGGEVGVAVGFGADFKVTKNSTVGIEFVHYDLGSADYQTTFSGEAGGALAAFGNAASGGTIGSGSKESLTFQTVSLNLNWSF